jgi:hypothetical protein
MDEFLKQRVYRQIKKDEGRDDLIRAMDAIDHLEWKLPQGLSKQNWARLDIDTSGRDALKAVTNIFSAYLPTWDVLPRGPKDKVNAERLERWIEWCFMRQNERGDSNVTWSVVKSAAKFDMVVARVEYLPYYITGEPTKRQKMALRRGPFSTRVFHPLSVHYEDGEWGLEWVADFAVYSAEEVVSHWQVFDNPNDKEKGGDHVHAAIKKIKDYIKSSGADGRARLAVLDYTDLDKRYVVAVKADNDVASPELILAEPDDMIEIMYVDNDLPFNPWVVAAGGASFEKDPKNKIDPLLAPLHKANLWSNQNLHESLQTSKTLKRYGFPDMVIYTASGEKKRVDFSGESSTLNLKLNQERADPMVAPPEDPAMAAVVERGRGRISSTTGVKVLQDIDIGGNLQFATVQILLQMALGAVTPYKNVAENALSQIGERFLEWVVFTGDEIDAFYLDDYGNTDERKRGAQISINPKEIDMETTVVKCSLKANTPTDKQQRVNMAVLANTQLGVPKSELVEDLGYGSPEVLENDYMKEKIKDMALATFLQVMQASGMLKLQQAAQGMQGAEPPQQGIPSPSQQNIGGEGFNQAAGGQSPLTADPNLTREGVTGQSMTGQGAPGAL